MGFFFWWWKRRDGPRCASPCGPRGAGWAGPTTLLCVYGFCSMMRPIEPFLTEFLSGPDKNFTTGQVRHIVKCFTEHREPHFQSPDPEIQNQWSFLERLCSAGRVDASQPRFEVALDEMLNLTRQVYPVWTYFNILLLVPVLLVTDRLRYKPVVVLQALCNLLAFLLLLVGPPGDVACARAALFVYSLAWVADVAYFSYIYSLVSPRRYQRATGYVRGAMLLGYAAGATLGQLLVSAFAVALRHLAAVSVASLAAALAVAIALPMPQKCLFERETARGAEVEGTDAMEDLGCRAWSLRAVRYAGRALKGLAADCVGHYSSVAVVFFSVWFAAGRCGFYQVTSYIQVLWLDKQPQHNFTAYNGAVDAVATLSGAAASLAVGQISLDWAAWGELILGGFTALISVALFLINLTDNIWVSYACFALFKALYMLLTTVCTFQIAKSQSLQRYALVFGLNSFAGTILQTALTGVVINTRSLRLTLSSQFSIYAAYFGVLALLFVVRGAYVALQAKRSSQENQAERAGPLPEVPHRPI
ncbi:Thiamine transporter 2 [Merluccius polli]|uniref:Thiamine transporter 2 n=1 Tax=Merluccius polli TaxID=89951 RepID=A0AA47MA06_MERPO|nr:Thiamine transporter 2 [Merluccius polli]